ncbi:MAG: tRNA (adenosine(37)-N6)-threonylcarbamoyltransferase complex ATPase subunit type 1 TsaE [Eubacteriales bacterium]|nr:tRNA (adenosine(37)-N6)-threonylcarbamoyltransferase complex ATPase subunit type 1 TsaE [Eubacteriales bacterium]
MIKESFSEQETYLFAKELGANSKKGEIYCLNGDLGTGKTVFAKGFAEGLNIHEAVTSPTFTIVKEYEDGRIPLYHFDVYRISDPDEMYAIGYEEYFFGDGVCLIEWSELIEELIPEDAIHIDITKDLNKDFDYRKIEIRR